MMSDDKKHIRKKSIPSFQSLTDKRESLAKKMFLLQQEIESIELLQREQLVKEILEIQKISKLDDLDFLNFIREKFQESRPKGEFTSENLEKDIGKDIGKDIKNEFSI